MTESVKEYVRRCEQRDYPEEEICDDWVLEAILESTHVWKDSYIEEHRWYSVRDIVVKYEGEYIKYKEYLITGDATMADMDLKYNLDDFKFVEKTTRTITETYYE